MSSALDARTTRDRDGGSGSPSTGLTSRQVRLAILALAMGGFTIGTTEFVTMGLIREIAAGVDVSVASAGHVISAYALGVVVGAPLIAFPLARVSRRRLLIGCMALFAFGNGLSMMAPSFSTLLVFRFASGIPHGAYLGIAALMAASLVERDKRASAVATVILGLTLATPLAILRSRGVLATVFGPNAVPADFGTRGGGLLGLRPSSLTPPRWT